MSKRNIDLNLANIPNKQKNCNIDINLEQDVIKYYLMPSLQHMSARNVIITLWSNADIKPQTTTMCDKDDFHKCISKLFLDIDDKILDKVVQLPLPDPIKKSLANVIHPIGKEIINWIEYQDEYIFNIDCYYGYQYMQPTAIRYTDDLVWTSRGVIDYKRTAKRLTLNENLNDDYKYRIACEYCLEDDIAIIASNLYDSEWETDCIRNPAMANFWTAHITGDFTELDEAVCSYNRKYSTNYSTNECIFKMLSDDLTNEIAIRYIWDKLDNEEKSRQIIPAIKNSSNIDIRCFFLSQMSKEQEREVFESCYAKLILLEFLDNWLWGQYFLPTIHHIWDIMTGRNYLAILEDIVNKMNKIYDDTGKYIQYRSILKELWKCSPQRLKGYIFDSKKFLEFTHCVLFNLSWEKNVDIVKSMLFYCNDIQKKEIIFAEKGIDKCEHFITSNQWDLLEMFVGSTLPSKDDVECFKHKFMEEKGEYTAEHFMRNEERENFIKLMQWAFKTEEEIKKFGEKLACGNICDSILQPMVKYNKAYFAELEIFLKWCALDDEETVVKYKAKIAEYYFSEVISESEEDNYELLEQILNWCFACDRKRIGNFKQNIYNDHKRPKIVELVFNLVKQDDQLQSLKMFADYWCSTDEELNKLKTCILYPTEDVGVCPRLLCRDLFELADQLVNWCCNSSQIQIDNFKNQLMVNDLVGYFPAGDNLLKVVRWYNPSVETIIRFKVKFVNCWWLKYVVPAFDKFLQDQK